MILSSYLSTKNCCLSSQWHSPKCLLLAARAAQVQVQVLLHVQGTGQSSVHSWDCMQVQLPSKGNLQIPHSLERQNFAEIFSKKIHQKITNTEIDILFTLARPPQQLEAVLAHRPTRAPCISQQRCYSCCNIWQMILKSWNPNGGILPGYSGIRPLGHPLWGTENQLSIWNTSDHWATGWYAIRIDLMLHSNIGWS